MKMPLVDIDSFRVMSGVGASQCENCTVKLAPNGLYDVGSFTPLSGVNLAPLLDKLGNMTNPQENESVIAEDLYAGYADVKYHPIIGYYVGLLAGAVEEGDFRENGSSGGLGTWLLEQLLLAGEIDGVVHFQPVDRSVTGKLFEYRISHTPEEIRKGAKSRYYPGELSECLRTLERLEGRYAVTAIPSFAAELRLLQRHDPRFKRKISFIIGLICGHQKSANYADALAWQHGIEPGNLRAINFRKKRPGERAGKYLTEMRGFRNGEEVKLIKSARELFVSNWAHGFFKAKFSDYTDDTFNETSDIALGDAWLDEYSHDYRGTNILIIRHPKILEKVERGQRDGRVKVERITEEQVLRSQRGLVHHTRDELPYRLWKLDRWGEWRPIRRLQSSGDLPFLRRRVQDVRMHIAQYSHQAFLSAKEQGDWGYFVRRMQPWVWMYRGLYKALKAQTRLRHNR